MFDQGIGLERLSKYVTRQIMHIYSRINFIKCIVWDQTEYAEELALLIENLSFFHRSE